MVCLILQPFKLTGQPYKFIGGGYPVVCQILQPYKLTRRPSKFTGGGLPAVWLTYRRATPSPRRLDIFGGCLREVQKALNDWTQGQQ